MNISPRLRHYLPSGRRGYQNPADFGGSDELLFECEDDSTLDLIIVDPGNAVMVRDKNDLVEYLG
jgi:hypothetical protein